jgi:hypothetical protein
MKEKNKVNDDDDDDDMNVYGVNNNNSSSSSSFLMKKEGDGIVRQSNTKNQILKNNLNLLIMK